MQEKRRYVSSLFGGFWQFDVKDFSYLVNPYFPPPTFFESLGTRLEELVRSYPSTNWYISSLASVDVNLSHEELVIGNGASELITALINRYVKNLAIPVPSFDEYINRAYIQGKAVSLYQMDEEYQLNIEEFIHYASNSGANSALIINPNNPTGVFIPRDSVYFILESLRALDLVIVDESFIDFVGIESHPSVMDRINDFPNLVIIKSLSKSYGIPGLRLGYAVSSNREIITNLRKDVPIWSINSLAQFFLEQMGSYRKEFLQSCVDVQAATKSLYRGLDSVSYLHAYPSEGNFVLCKTLSGWTASDLTDKLFDKFAILINDCSRKNGLDSSFVRIASRTQEENTELVEALKVL
jgi:histidinol-phosphate/aromatic aminotransferase/cobyric acid decarboxylase-like protein